MSDLQCCPEWCEQESNRHDHTCPEAKLTLTKADFVAKSEVSAMLAIESYVTLIGLGHPPDEAKEVAVEEVNEAAFCFAGIGSCGRGWCNHS